MKSGLNAFIFTIIFFNNVSGQVIPYGQEFLVNTYTQGRQTKPALAQLTNGTLIICWESEGQDGSDTGIFGQMFDASRNKIGNEFQINTYTRGFQSSPTVSPLEDGGFVVCWESFQDGSFYGVFGQLFDSCGSKRGQEFQVNSHIDNNQIFPAVAGLRGGNFIVCWQSYGGFHAGWGICGQLFNASGAKEGNEFQADSPYWEQSNPVVSALDDGGFVVCWESNYQDGSKLGVFGQIFDHSGRKKGNNFRVNTFTAWDQCRPSVTTLRDGSFVVCWHSRGQDGSEYGIFGQLFEASGNKIGGEFQINSYIYDSQLLPAVSGLIDGGFVVCWQSDGQDGSESGIYGQLFDGVANKRELEFKINTHIESYQNNPAVIGLPNGGFLACWESWGSQDGSDCEIFSKFLPEKPVIHQLMEFSLLEPFNDATISPTRPTFKWQQPSNLIECYSWEITFDLYLDFDFAFSNPRIIKNIHDTTYTIDLLEGGKTYFWKVLAKNHVGDSLWSKQQDWGFFVRRNPTSIMMPDTNIPQNFGIDQNYPNPFNQDTQIRFQLPVASHTALKIFNTLGQEIRTIVDQQCEAGYHTVRWDGRDNHGNLVGSGTYLYQIKAGDFVAIKKLVVLK